MYLGFKGFGCDLPLGCRVPLAVLAGMGGQRRGMLCGYEASLEICGLVGMEPLTLYSLRCATSPLAPHSQP